MIGPRPERPEFFPQLELAIPHYRDRLLVKPGVTGLAQVQLPPDTDLDSVRIKLAYDLFYIQHFTFWMDVRLVLATVLKMFAVPFAHIGFLFGCRPARSSRPNINSGARSQESGVRGQESGIRSQGSES